MEIIKHRDDYGTDVYFKDEWPLQYYVAVLDSGECQAIADGESIGNFEHRSKAIDAVDEYIIDNPWDGAA